MRPRLFYFLIIILMASCAEDSVDLTGKAAPEDSLWPAGVALLAIGILLGIILCRTGVIPKKRKKITSLSSSGTANKIGEEDTPNSAEMRVYELEAQLKTCRHKASELSRALAEAEKFAATASYVNANTEIFDARFQTSAAESSSADNGRATSTRLYFLQPTTDGWFKDTSQVESPTDALYELNCAAGLQNEASVIFIDTPANTSMAIQNESTWLLVACERSNIVTAGTTSVRTDKPGKAVLENGAWKIIDKAKITYC